MKLRAIPTTRPVDVDRAIHKDVDLPEDVGMDTSLMNDQWENAFTVQRKAIGQMTAP